MLCPACENESENTQQCLNCGWQFVYFTQEPSEREQNEYTLLLQNYRTEFFYAKALEYFEHKQYEETIQCCYISCEKQMYDNPLVLLGLSFQVLENYDEALKYVTMALEINPNNEAANELLSELSTSDKPVESKIITLTPEILKKDMFETTEEYADRIKTLGYVEIGKVELDGYDANYKNLRIRAHLNKNLNTFSFKHKLLSSLYIISLESNSAKELYTKEFIPLTSSLEIQNNKIVFTDLKVGDYSFINEFLELQQSKIDKEKLELEDRQQKEIERQNLDEEMEDWYKKMPITYIDEKTRIEWNLKLCSNEHEISNSWYPEYNQDKISSFLNSLSPNNSKQAAILKYLTNKKIKYYFRNIDNNNDIGNLELKRIRDKYYITSDILMNTKRTIITNRPKRTKRKKQEKKPSIVNKLLNTKWF